MLKKRLIPILLLNNGRCVKGAQFKNFIDTGHPVTAARVYDAQTVDELVFLDISASSEKRDILFDIVSQVAEECFMPLTVGGGVRTMEDISKLLRAGADKVSINTYAIENPDFLKKAAQEFGRANIVAAIDVRLVNGRYEAFTRGGEKSSGLEAIEWAKKATELGAGEILLTSIDREGTRKGYDLDLLRQISEAIDVPIVANGGVGTLQHLVDGIKIGGASAVAAASIFHFTDQSPIKARSFMKEAGLDVRVDNFIYR